MEKQELINQLELIIEEANNYYKQYNKTTRNFLCNFFEPKLKECYLTYHQNNNFINFQLDLRNEKNNLNELYSLLGNNSLKKQIKFLMDKLENLVNDTIKFLPEIEKTKSDSFSYKVKYNGINKKIHPIAHQDFGISEEESGIESDNLPGLNDGPVVVSFNPVNETTTLNEESSILHAASLIIDDLTRPNHSGINIRTRPFNDNMDAQLPI